MKIKPFAFGVTIVVAILFGLFKDFQHNQRLSAERAKTEQAVSDARAAIQIADAAILFAAQKEQESRAHAARASEAEARAVAAETRRTVLQPEVERIIAAAPNDTNVKVLRAALEEADSTSRHYKTAFHEQLAATAKLQVAYDSVVSANTELRERTVRLANASENLVNASRKSFWDHLIPEIGFGVGAGVGATADLLRRDMIVGPSVVVGPTLTWRF